MSKGDLNCWLCNRVFGNHPDNFYALWDKVEDLPLAVCEGCLVKAKKLYERNIGIAEAIG